MSSPRISVVVPVYNVAEFLRECLDSLLRQGEVETEVLMIDDGSTDGSDKVVDEYAAKHENFRAFHIENGGLGHARNLALQHSRGEYVFFIDSDDILVEGTLEKMFGLAERHDADVTICNVLRFRGENTQKSEIHTYAFRQACEVTHIRQTPELVYDTTAWNKLIRRCFLSSTGLKFGENMLFEDIPLTIPLHILANKVAVLNEVGYLWRIRDGANRSITNSSHNLQNLTDRLLALSKVDDFLASHPMPEEFMREYWLKSLRIDLRVNIYSCRLLPAEDTRTRLRLMRDYLVKTIPDGICKLLPSFWQRIYSSVRNVDVRAFRSLMAAYEPHPLPYGPHVSSIIAQDGSLLVSCSVAANRPNEIRAELWNEVKGESIDLEVLPGLATSQRKRDFDVRIDPAKLAASTLSEGEYRIRAGYGKEFQHLSEIEETWQTVKDDSEGVVLTADGASMSVGYTIGNRLYIRIARGVESASPQDSESAASSAVVIDCVEGPGCFTLSVECPHGTTRSGDELELCVEDKVQETIVALARAVVGNDGVSALLRLDFNDEVLSGNLYSSIRAPFVNVKRDGVAIARLPMTCRQWFAAKAKAGTLMAKMRSNATRDVRLIFTNSWPEPEDTAAKRKVIATKVYNKYRLEPINPNMIVFESMWGTKYSCNPMALYEYIDANYPQFECVWSFTDERMPIKGRGRKVRRGSQEYWHCLATAKFLVTNVNFEDGYRKRPGQIEIQTMHGTPLKTLGLDVAADFPTEVVRNAFLRRCHRWDYLIVQGRFVEEKAAQIYDFQKTILKTGYPRTDRLFSPDQGFCERLKAELGIPSGKKVVLYAPTWRIMKRFEMKLDVAAMKAALGNEYVLLFKAHHLCLPAIDVAADGEFIFDLTMYSSIEDLYAISDVLITDYSSAMFDYALLRRPMLFYCYDMDEYCNIARGLYVDFRNEAPGPILYDTAGVISALKDLERTTAEYSERTAKFHEKYLAYERPDSSEQVVRQVMLSPARISYPLVSIVTDRTAEELGQDYPVIETVREAAAAHGKYIYFLADGDNLESGAISTLTRIAESEKLDIVMFNAPTAICNYVMTGAELLSGMSPWGAIPASITTLFFRSTAQNGIDINLVAVQPSAARLYIGNTLSAAQKVCAIHDSLCHGSRDGERAADTFAITVSPGDIAKAKMDLAKSRAETKKAKADFASANKRLAASKAEVRSLWASESYRLGKTILWPARAVKRLFLRTGKRGK